MSSFLPPEILDLIIDHLHDEPTALKPCCVVSKSWVPRTRRHLFERVEFDGRESSIRSWIKVFPDPSNSPAHHTLSLSIRNSDVVTSASPDAHAWIRSFDHLVKLQVDTLGIDAGRASLVQFYRLSPVLRSLYLFNYLIPLSEVFDLVCSFPLLEDLSLPSVPVGLETEGRDTPSTSPKLTGSLYLSGGARSVSRRLLDLPGGLRFSRISMLCYEDADSVMELVSRCSDTLEYLSVNYFFSSAFSSAFRVDQRFNTTHGPRPVRDPTSVGPLQDQKTQRRGVSVGKAGRPMDHRNTPNHSIQNLSEAYHLRVCYPLQPD
jgi:hypothetical protein